MIRSTLMVLAMMLALGAPLAAQQESKFAVGDAAPDIETSKAWNNNGKTKLSDFKGEYVLINFWATW
jgi:hypothetical protein